MPLKLEQKLAIQALLNSFESHFIEEVSKAIYDYKKVQVEDPSGPDLIKKANQRLLHLKRVSFWNKELRNAMEKFDERLLQQKINGCHGDLGDKVKDVSLYGKAKEQLNNMRRGKFQNKRRWPNYHVSQNFDEMVKKFNL